MDAGHEDNLRVRLGNFGVDILIPEEAIPDLLDPATFGCLLYLVRQAYCIPDLCAVQWEHGWVVYLFPSVKFIGHSEIEALVSALEHANERPLQTAKEV
jgi:hypothetical protein